MYLQHFGLVEQPFSLTPNTQFFMNSSGHQEALNLLLVALENGEGFIKIAGEVGTGKTLLCRKLLGCLDESYITAYIPNPYLSADGLRIALAEELGLEVPITTGRHRLMKMIMEKLLQLNRQGKHVVMMIDEAQAMPEDTLEALRLLTNLETECTKLMQVILFGQPELDELLSKHSLRQLRQRITFSYKLMPLDRIGVERYVLHRLAKAGFNGSVVVTQKALDLLHQTTGGIPRLVNILTHKALMVSFGQGEKLVETDHMKSAINDTEGVAVPSLLNIPAIKYSGLVAVAVVIAVLLVKLIGEI